jgi:DNA-binding transcriptional LysR family regulator
MNLAYLDLVSIRLAVFGAEDGSLSAAARRAQLSLSRASYRLSALEHGVGLRLFERSSHGLVPTRAGQILAIHGKELLDQVTRLSTELSPESGRALVP